MNCFHTTNYLRKGGCNWDAHDDLQMQTKHGIIFGSENHVIWCSPSTIRGRACLLNMIDENQNCVASVDRIRQHLHWKTPSGKSASKDAGQEQPVHLNCWATALPPAICPVVCFSLCLHTLNVFVRRSCYCPPYLQPPSLYLCVLLNRCCLFILDGRFCE